MFRTIYRNCLEPVVAKSVGTKATVGVSLLPPCLLTDLGVHEHKQQGRNKRGQKWYSGVGCDEGEGGLDASGGVEGAISSTCGDSEICSGVYEVWTRPSCRE